MAAQDGQNNPHAQDAAVHGVGRETARDAGQDKDRDAVRPGEMMGVVPEATDAALHFIGWIETPWERRGACPRQGDRDAGPLCQVHVTAPYRPALLGLDAFDQIELLYWLHGARRDLLQQTPRNDGVAHGAFALRSPLRPNPIGTSLVRLIRVAETGLVVRGLDCLNGTPLLDIKPDRCAYTPLASPR